MTQPPTPPPVEHPQIQAHFELQTGTDGHPWVKCTLQWGLAVFAFLATEHQAEQLASILGNGFAEGAVAARRARLGLILPGETGAAQSLANGARPT